MNKPNSHSQPPPSPSRLVRLWKYWLRPLLVIVACVFVLRSTVLDWNVVPTGSMRPTILEGDYVLVNRLAYDAQVPLLGWKLTDSASPQRGDIVIFAPPGNSSPYIKRILGLPGEVVQMRNHRLYVDGKPVGYDFPDQPLPRLADADEGWPLGGLLAGRAHAAPVPSHRVEGTLSPRKVPVGEYFVLGDNRGHSKDSRFFGFVPRDRIIGRAVRVLISFDPDRVWWPRFNRFFR